MTHRASRLALAFAVARAVLGCDALSGDELDLSTCRVPSDCMLAANGCCGTCGAVTPASVTAINVAAQHVHQRRLCGDQDRGCPGIACRPEPPALIATCEAGRCVAMELAKHPSTECATHADCSIRSAMCCECNAPTHVGALVAVSDGEAFRELVCDPEQACDECGASYPPEVSTACESGSCVVHDFRPF